MTGIDLLRLRRPEGQQQQQQEQQHDAIDEIDAVTDASDPSTTTEYVLDRAPTQTAGSRLHAKCGGRYVSVVRLNSGGLACVSEGFVVRHAAAQCEDAVIIIICI